MNTLYTIQGQSHDNRVEGTIHVNAKHAVFNGHFPDRAVMPGVCMIQMLTDLLNDKLELRLKLKSITAVKFVHMWLPDEHEQTNVKVLYQRTDDTFWIKSASIYINNTVFFKFKGYFHVEH